MKLNFTFCVLLGFFVVIRQTNGKNSEFEYDPDMDRNVSGLISSKGYPVEEHVVQTQDGYLLTVQRIPHGRGNKTESARPPVLLQHGLLMAASDWVVNFPEQSLGFILADAGYDVWLGNSRGNTYSREHIKYTPDMDIFWDFSFDQMAEYDLPAMIDYVLNKTELEEIVYIGHSQGTTSAFALLSENAAFNKKIKLFIALAPVATVGHTTTPIRYLAPFANDIQFLFDLLGVKEFLPYSGFQKFVSEHVCATDAKFLCVWTMFLLYGKDEEQLNSTRLDVYTAHSPAGSSVKSVLHYAQMVSSKKFTKYDYGEANLSYYNQTSPPEYDVSKITAPVALLWSLNDALADPVDVIDLETKLKPTSLVTSYRVPFAQFNHYDFAIAIHANRLVYDEVLKLLKQYK